TIDFAHPALAERGLDFVRTKARAGGQRHAVELNRIAGIFVAGLLDGGSLMHRMLIGIALVASMAAVAAPAAAQRRTAPRTQPRTPATGMWAVGGSVGAAAPMDAALQNGIDLAGNVERYLTPRVSVRGQIGASWWDIQGHSFAGTVRPFFAD